MTAFPQSTWPGWLPDVLAARRFLPTKAHGLPPAVLVYKSFPILPGAHVDEGELDWDAEIDANTQEKMVQELEKFWD